MDLDPDAVLIALRQRGAVVLAVTRDTQQPGLVVFLAADHGTVAAETVRAYALAIPGVTEVSFSPKTRAIMFVR